jgi:cytochrome c biogenesis protein
MGQERRNRPHLISQRTAIVTISILLVASAAGWLLTEFFPPDIPVRREMYRQKWGDTAYSLIDSLKLYDPFHSFWFSGVLALFLAVLILCLATRWRRMIVRTFRLTVPAQPPGRDREAPGFDIPLGQAADWTDERDPVAHYGKKFGKAAGVSADALSRIVEITRKAFSSRGYRTAFLEKEGRILFAAEAGSWRHTGNLIFHLGLVVITVGGIAGSWLGSSEMLYGKRGDVLPLTPGGASLRVDGFRIVMGGQMQISDYIASVTVLDSSGAELKSDEIEVNHPLRYGGTSVYQSSYYIAEDEFDWAKITVTAGRPLQPAALTLRPGEKTGIPGTDLALTAGRFFPDFRMTAGGPMSVSSAMNNPALEIILDGPGKRTSGWIFLRFPDFSTKFDRLDSIKLLDIEPTYYTGLQFSRNPGEHIFMAGMILGAAGLLLLYAFDHRVVRGSVGETGLSATGITARWKVSFAGQLDSIRKEISAAIEKEGLS